MKSEKILSAIGKISDDLVKDADVASNKRKSHSSWKKVVAVAACICLLITGGSVLITLFGENENISLNPLVITVYAHGEDGSVVPTPLKVGEKVKMQHKASTQLENFEGYAFDLTLLESGYVCPVVVTENWEPKRYPGYSYQYTPDDFHWALTEGDDISVVHIDNDWNAIRPGVNELTDPDLHGSSIIWRPNNDGLDRCIIGAYDEDFNLVCKYYLEITESNGNYYAEIVKIV